MGRTSERLTSGTFLSREWPSGLVSAEAVAAKVGMPAVRLLELADAQIAPHWRIDGGQPLFRIKELREWLASTQLIRRYEGKPLPLSLVITSDTKESTTGVPSRLRPLAGDLKLLPHSMLTCGVYFLCSGEEVVYVGQSITPLTRIASHRTNTGMVFDTAYLYPCLDAHLDLLESAFIRAWKPRFNRSPGPVPAAESVVRDLFPIVAQVCAVQDASAVVACVQELVVP